jgi:hypothetical protein
MMTDLYLNHRSPFYEIDIESVEYRRNATYMGTWPVRIYNEGNNDPADIFYLHSPQRVGKKVAAKYIAIVRENGKTYAMVADDIFQRYPIFGVEAENGEVCCSRFLEDTYVSEDASVIISGGPTNIITDRPDRIVRVLVQDDKYHFERLGEPLVVVRTRKRLPLNGSNS